MSHLTILTLMHGQKEEEDKRCEKSIECHWKCDAIESVDLVILDILLHLCTS